MNPDNLTKLKSIEFGMPPFRKFKNITLEFGQRLTVLAGHNGLGKSTILGLVANASGITKAAHKSYFERNYSAPIEDILVLSPDFDYQNDRRQKPNVLIKYQQGDSVITKRCNVTKNISPDSLRLRVHPRSVEFQDGKEKLGSAAKVPIPTIYVGMSRMVPIGENKDEDIHKADAKVHIDDDAYIKRCFHAVLNTQSLAEGPLQAYTVRNARKKSRVPDLGIDTFSISLGQDSVSVIVNALASFNKIKRELGEEYAGGILAIDEIESGLHPRAQIRMMSLLKKEAKSLGIQIVMTTHSLTVIKEVFATSEPKVDAVRYFMNSDNPVLLTDSSYLKIEADMLSNPLLGNAASPIQKIYFEDDEALFFFEEMLQATETDISATYGTELRLISTRLGCNELLGLAQADDDLKNVIVIFDNDTMTSEKNRRIFTENKNFLALPLSPSFQDNTPGKKRTPEAVLFGFLEGLCDGSQKEENEDFWYTAAQVYGYSTDSVREISQEFTSIDGEREQNKSIFRKHQRFFKGTGLVSLWCDRNMKVVSEFMQQLDRAIRYCHHMKKSG